MYIMLTERCNMSCAHCCMSATSKGQDMTEKVFRKAVEMDCMVALGGGEPTIHPKFWQFMAIVLADRNIENIWLATNGSQTETALALAKMAKSGVIGCALSQDKFHDPIHHDVVEAFTKKKNNIFGDSRPLVSDQDQREIRTINKIMSVGRGKDIGTEDGCPCSETIIRPNGDMYWCGCDGAPKVGNVLSGGFDPIWEEERSNYDCYRTSPTKELNSELELEEVA